MKDKGAIPNSMVHAEEANRIITIEGNRNFSFFCLGYQVYGQYILVWLGK